MAARSVVPAGGDPPPGASALRMFFLRVRRVHQAARVEHAGEAAAGAELALDLQPRAVQAEHVLHDREAEAGAAARARARGRDAVEAFRDARQVLRRDPL